jgi:membrane protein DedA with SNARE-associated domain
VKLFIVKWGKYLLISGKDLTRAEEWFEKYEDWAVLICRVVPLVRSFISIPAGYVKMPFLKFTALTAVGTAAWSTLLVYLGIVFGQTYTRFVPYFRKLDYVFAAIFLALAAYYLYRKIKEGKILDPRSGRG